MQRLDEIDGLYHLDSAHSAISFTVRHAGLVRVRGTFDQFHGYAVFDRSDVNSSALMVSIQVGSINTQMADRDAHLRTPDFFDIAQFPAITYVGTGFELLDDEHVLVHGDLTIRDVTRPLDLTFTYTGSAVDPFGGRRIGFEGHTRISRKDFGLTWNAALETGGWLVSDEAKVEIDVSAVQQDADVQVPRRATIVSLAGGLDEPVVAASEGAPRRGVGLAEGVARPRRAAVDD